MHIRGSILSEDRQVAYRVEFLPPGESEWLESFTTEWAELPEEAAKNRLLAQNAATERNWPEAVYRVVRIEKILREEVL